MDNHFIRAYRETIATCAGNDFSDNYDTRRFGVCPQPPSDFKHRLKNLAVLLSARTGLLKAYRSRLAMQRGFGFVEPHLRNLEWLYQQLQDEESRQTLVQVVAYRALGHKKVKLPLNNPDYWASIESIERQMQGAESIDLGFNEWRAHRMHLAALGYPIELFFRPTGIVTQFVLQQYRCRKATGTIEVSDGDVVLDAGGCYGDTALYFAFKAGSLGQVYSFEFLPDNLEVFRRNKALNPGLSEHIHIIERPLWSRTGERLYIEGHGPGTQVHPTSADPRARQIATLSIDDFVRSENLSKVDFIKMDIEGAEIEALHGAIETIRRFRPRLAITVYHHLEDFWAIPAYLDSLRLGYRFYLRHFTIHAEETVLFAEST